MNRKLEMLLEVFFVSLIMLDIFLLFISIFAPIRPSSFHNIALFDLFTSIFLVVGYLIRMRHKNPLIYLKTHWNGVIAVIPFYFIGLNVLGLFEALIFFKILNLLKIIALIMASRQVGKSVDQFVEKSRLVYGFSFFVVVLLLCSLVFFMVERGVNPQVTNFEDSLWYVIQTITTVGYGDVVPFTEIGRLVGVIAMLSAIGISSLVTAVATSSLMEKFRKERDKLKEQSINYIEKLERNVENLNSEMAKKEHIEELRRDIGEIKSQIENLKEMLKKRDDV